MNHQPDSLARFPLAFLAVALLYVAPVALSTGCQSLWSNTITLTSVVDSASKDFAHAYNAGLVPPDVARKVANAHKEFRLAAASAHDALVAFKASQEANPNSVVGFDKSKFEPARLAAVKFIDTVSATLAQPKVEKLRLQLQKASRP